MKRDGIDPEEKRHNKGRKMKKAHIYTSGEFARKANVSIRTIRYYDKEGLLRPTHISDSGYRLYTDADFAKLQKILSLKYLGFSLTEVGDLTMRDNDPDFVARSLEMQLALVRKKMEGLQQVEEAICETAHMVQENQEVDWEQILQLIHVIGMEKDLPEQYKNANNLKVRIGLHKKYSTNPEGWYSWIFRQIPISEDVKILDLGCGNGELWRTNTEKLPPGLSLILSDLSPGMIKDAKKHLRGVAGKKQFQVFDAAAIPAEDNAFDLVLANHMLFYVKDRKKVLEEVARVLRPGGTFFCSTYGANHMKEVSLLAKGFDERIALAEVNLNEVFGLENGARQLEPFFEGIERLQHEDTLHADRVGPILEYILSCHGNQHDYLKDRYEEFCSYLEKKRQKNGELIITKEAGAFLCKGPIKSNSLEAERGNQ